jgi:hypothetical protein
MTVPIPPQRATQRKDLYLYIVLLDRLARPTPLYQLGFRDQHSCAVDQRQQHIERTAAQFHRFAVN